MAVLLNNSSSNVWSTYSISVLQIEKLSQMDVGDLQQRDFTLKIEMDISPLSQTKLTMTEYYHHFSLEEIAPLSESTGKIAVLDGAGACPPEDRKGNFQWSIDILKLQSNKPAYRGEVISQINGSMNYKDKPVPADFDPDQFDIAEARERVHAALASPDSATTGAKQFMYPLHPAALDKPAPGTPFAPNEGPEARADVGRGPGRWDGRRPAVPAGDDHYEAR
ncbi:hypothetical protein EWM64_g2372 [Hericium alpestre]|uniref:Uncharacterized protein n=1 Tax=Hericium alpestre TaxID=135208 RepID=A0A4Z0A4L3_9AGAM|nr:hypothetical protein EWM64_g2372 [Hericium alpestre]